MIKKLSLTNLSKDLGFYFWIKNKSTNEEWSPELLKIIDHDSIKSLSIHEFINLYVYENDQYALIEKTNNFFEKNIPFEIEIRIKKNSRDYYWLVCKSSNELSNLIDFDEKLLLFFDINESKKHKIRYEENRFFYQESAEMTRSGGWFIDFEYKKMYWDKATEKILRVDNNTIPSIKKGISFFAREYKFKAVKHFLDCSLNGFPFQIEVKLNAPGRSNFWTIIIGKPIYEGKKIIGMRGVIQDIYDLKMKELSIRKSMDIISSQNARLHNFAHIVSHNLRSHSSNLELVTELIKDAEDVEEREEFINTVADISVSLNQTIEHLNEVAAIHTLINKKMELINFNDTLKLVTSSINQIITKENAVIEKDFSQAEEIMYIPAYLESMLLNLITNAIKYKHDDRNPHIQIKTFKKDDSISLTVKDNGSGIDLALFGSKIFGMYKTFHRKENAVGIGLFITKNQIESMGGIIDVESEVGSGTTFTINF